MLQSRNKKYEELMEKVGDFGRFQKRLCALLVLSTVPNGYFALLMVFVGRTPPFRCFLPWLDSGAEPNTSSSFPQMHNTSTIRSLNLNDTQQWQMTNQSHLSLSKNSKAQYDNKCEMLVDFNKTRKDGLSLGRSNDTVDNATFCEYGMIYGFEEGRSSIVTEWDLVCDRAWILPVITSIYMSGVLVGSAASGVLSDKYGRYPTFLLGTLLMFVFLAFCGLSTSPTMFTVFLFFAGAFGFINYVTAFVIAAEMINAKNRVVTGTLTVGGFAVGYMFLPLFAYYIPNWRHLCFTLASLGVVFIPYIWLMTESPRWLFSKGRYDDFIKLFRKIASLNGISIEETDNIVEEFRKLEISDEEKLLHSEDSSSSDVLDGDGYKTTQEYSYLDLLRTGVVRSRTLNMWFTWFVCSVVYYGVGFNTSNMGGDPYINCFVAAAVEIPAYAMVIALLKWQGRKPILICTLVVAGLTCSAVPYLQNINNDLAIGFAMTGKLAVSGSFTIIYIYCSELFPTLMRSMSVGSASMASRVGGMAAPYLLYVGKSHESIPYLVMGVLAVTACLFNAVLPETKDTALPESIEDLPPIEWFTCGNLSRKRRLQKHSELTRA